MSLNTLFSPEPSLQEGFLDKSTGLPLSFGLVFFYSDNNRTVLKPIYMLSGSPPNYSYTPLPNPVILSGIGTIQDGNGNDVIPYFYPYDVNHNVELYYIVVTDQFGVQQFTRQGFPNIAQNPALLIAAGDNFVPNGQFLLWNPPASYPQTKYTFDYGGVIGVTDVIDVAPGGWTFQVSTGAVATYTIQFNQLLSSVSNPSSSPRYEIEIIRSAPGGHADPICDLRIRFMDVNKFQSSGINDTWTLLFNAEANSTLNNVTVHLIRYYGTNDGSTVPADTTIDDLWGGPLNITTSQQTFAVSDIFGLNTGKTIGNNNNDFLEFAIRLPASASQIFDVKFTDFMLLNQEITQNQANSIVFPATTNGEFVLQALSNIAPVGTTTTTTNYYQEDGSNLYLPMVMTQKGFKYDDSDIGAVFPKSSIFEFTGSISTTSNELIADGGQYKVSDYSPLGIPYRRLFNKLFYSVTKLPLAGTGLDFVNSYVSAGTTDTVIMVNNKIGAQVVASNGAVSPGFTYQVNRLGQAATHFTAYTNITGYVLIRATAIGVVTPVASGTSGLTVAQLYNSPFNYATINFQCLSAAALGNGAGVGKYFDFYFGVGAANGIRMWFKTATESAPAAGGLTLVEVDLNINYTATDAAIVIISAINNFQVQSITTVAAAAIPVGSYFNFFANGTNYIGWYKKSGSGTAPAVVGAINIEIDILNTDTAAQVADKTRIALNSYQFAVPDLQGMFIRGQDTAARWELNQNETRFGLAIANLNQNASHTLQVSSNIEHLHAPLAPATVFYTDNSGAGAFGGVGTAGGLPTTAYQGTYEARPINYSLVYVIKY